MGHAEFVAAVKAMRAAQKRRNGAEADDEPKAAKELKRLERLVDAKLKEAEKAIGSQWKRQASSWDRNGGGGGSSWRG